MLRHRVPRREFLRVSAAARQGLLPCPSCARQFAQNRRPNDAAGDQAVGGGPRRRPLCGLPLVCPQAGRASTAEMAAKGRPLRNRVLGDNALATVQRHRDDLGRGRLCVRAQPGVSGQRQEARLQRVDHSLRLRPRGGLHRGRRALSKALIELAHHNGLKGGNLFSPGHRLDRDLERRRTAGARRLFSSQQSGPVRSALWRRGEERLPSSRRGAGPIQTARQTGDRGIENRHAAFGRNDRWGSGRQRRLPMPPMCEGLSPIPGRTLWKGRKPPNGVLAIPSWSEFVRP